MGGKFLRNSETKNTELILKTLFLLKTLSLRLNTHEKNKSQTATYKQALNYCVAKASLIVEKDFLLNRLNIITQSPFHVLTSAKPWQAVTRKVNRLLSPPTLVILFARKQSNMEFFHLKQARFKTLRRH